MILSKYARNKLVDAALRGVSITFPATLYVALLTSAPNSGTDAYTEIGTTTANGYARVSVTSDTTNWSATNGAGTTTNPSTGTGAATSSNNAAITFPNPSGGNWFYGVGPEASSITHIGLFDSATIGAGNLWYYVPLGQAKTVSSSDFSPNIPAGALSLTFDA